MSFSLQDEWLAGRVPEVRPFVPRPSASCLEGAPELPSGQHHLRGLLAHWLAGLGTRRKSDLAAFFRELPCLTFGCACSGSGCPTLCAEVLQHALEEVGISVTCRHMYATEIHPAKRSFLKRLFLDLPKLFCDVGELHKGRSLNVKDTPPKTAAVDEVHIFTAGFPCTDASNLNASSSSGSNRACVANASLRTGAVFRDILKHLRARSETKMVLFENVAGLAKQPLGRNCEVVGPSNLAAVLFLARAEAGFHLKVFHLTPTDFGVPQARARLWFVGVPIKLLASANMSLHECDSLLEGIMSGFAGQRLQALDDWLLPETHPLIQSEHRRLLFDHYSEHGQWSEAMMAGGGVLADAHRGKKRRRQTASGPRGSWPETHAALADERGLDWWMSGEPDSELVAECPGVLALSRRERDILKMKGIRIPDVSTSGCCIDLSQSALRTIDVPTHKCIAPCVTPSGRRYLTRRGRLTHPQEDLQLQGLFYVGREDRLAEFGGALLSDIAGNAFEASCCSASLLAGLLLVSHCEARMRSLRTVARPSLALSSTDQAGASRLKNKSEFHDDHDDDGLTGVFLVQ